MTVPSCFRHRNQFIGLSSAIEHFLASHLTLEAGRYEAIHVFLSEHEVEATCKPQTQRSVCVEKYVDVDRLMLLSAFERRVRIFEAALSSLRLVNKAFNFGWDEEQIHDAYLFALLMGDTYRAFLLDDLPNSRGDHFALPTCEWDANELRLYVCIFKHELELARRVHLFSVMAGNSMSIMGMSQKWKNSRTYTVRGGGYSKWSAEVDIDAASPVRLFSSYDSPPLIED